MTEREADLWRDLSDMAECLLVSTNLGHRVQAERYRAEIEAVVNGIDVMRAEATK